MSAEDDSVICGHAVSVREEYTNGFRCCRTLVTDPSSLLSPNECRPRANSVPDILPSYIEDTPWMESRLSPPAAAALPSAVVARQLQRKSSAREDELIGTNERMLEDYRQPSVWMF